MFEKFLQLCAGMENQYQKTYKIWCTRKCLRHKWATINYINPLTIKKA